VPDKAEVAFFAALAECLGADEVDIVKVSVIDDVAWANGEGRLDIWGRSNFRDYTFPSESTF